MTITPFIIVGLIGFVLEADYGYIYKTFLLFLVSIFLNILAYTGFDERYVSFMFLKELRFF